MFTDGKARKYAKSYKIVYRKSVGLRLACLSI